MKRFILGSIGIVVSAILLLNNPRAYKQLADETPFGKPPQEGIYFTMVFWGTVGLVSLFFAIRGYFAVRNNEK